MTKNMRLLTTAALQLISSSSKVVVVCRLMNKNFRLAYKSKRYFLEVFSNFPIYTLENLGKNSTPNNFNSSVETGQNC